MLVVREVVEAVLVVGKVVESGAGCWAGDSLISTKANKI